VIVGYASAFNEVLYSRLPLGRFAANASFIQALAAWSRADRIDLFFPTTFVLKKFQETVLPGLARPERIGLFSLAQVPRQLARTDYTAIHASDLSSFTPALLYLRRKYAPATPLTAITHSLNYRQIYADHLRRLLPGARPFDAVVATSQSAAQVVRRGLEALGRNLSPFMNEPPAYAGQVRRIPLGVDADYYRPQDQAPARDRLGLARDASVIVGLGRFSYFDKMDLGPLLKVMVELKQRRPDRVPILVLAGGDQEGYAAALGRQAAEMGLSGQVKLKPNLPEDKKADLYAAADVFVSPSDNVQETFGLTIIEAMACGRPVVASDFNGYRDLVADGETGFLAPTLSAPCHRGLAELSTLVPDTISQLVLAQTTAVLPQALADRLERLLDDESLRQKMGRAARDRVVANFAWERVIAQYDELWAELKAQAQSEKPAAEDRRDPFYQDFDHVFASYWSHQLPLKSPLTVTAWGRKLLAANEPPPVYADLSPWIDPEILRRIIAAIDDSPLGPADLIETMNDLDPDTVIAHVLWLLKHDYLRIEID
jgi:glycosyltransferase involved in cell wall biosynthesis